MTAPTTILTEVRAYAARGWQVFPLKPRSKEPATWRGFYDATTNPATLERWFAKFPYNVGVRTGVASGILILDIDGDAGAVGLRELEAKHGALPSTLSSRTGKGIHHWFGIDGPVPGSTSKVADRVDIKCELGYIVAPPSTHPTGKIYTWIEPAIPLAPAPLWLLTLARRRKVSQQALSMIRRPARTGPPGAYGQAALDREIADLAAAAPGTRNHQLNRAAFALAQLVAGAELERDQVVERLLDACTRNGLVKDDGLHSVRLTMRSAFHAGLRQPRSRTGAP
jgi:bifunctional DNA primase/polymerase-like protein